MANITWSISCASLRQQSGPLDILGKRQQELQLGALLDEAPRAVVRLDGSAELAVEQLFSWLG